MHSLSIQAAWPVRMTEQSHLRMSNTSVSCLTTVRHLHALTFVNLFQVIMNVSQANANLI